MTSQIAYRFIDNLYSNGCDEDGYSYGSFVKVYLHEYYVLKHTPKGFWIDNYGTKRFVLNGARKKFAHLNIHDAKASFIARKQRQYKIYSAKIQRVMKALKDIERFK